MTVSHKKTKVAAKPDDQTGEKTMFRPAKQLRDSYPDRYDLPLLYADAPPAAQPGVQYHCDVCEADITLTVRIRCAGGCKDFDLCGSCFCSGAEAKQHKAWHDYRIVEQHAYPIFSEDWGADEELLLIDGCQTYGLGNWADIADHIGNRSKEEVEAHYVAVYVEGRDGTQAGDARAEDISRKALADPTRTSRQLPMAGPNLDFTPRISADDFHQNKRRRISALRSHQAAMPIGVQKGAPPKPLVSAPTSHHELSGFMAGRLEFETEHEQDAEVLTKDMEFGKVYSFGGELLPSEEQALGGKAAEGRSRMEASGRGGVSSRGTAATVAGKGTEDGTAEDETAKEEATQDDHEADDDEEAANQTVPQDESMADVTVDAEESKASQTASKTKSVKAPDATSAAAAAPKDDEASTSERPPADWDEDPHDLELKLMILEMYNERLERRVERKSAILERGLVEVRRRQAAERRRPKEERDILNRVRHFAQLQTPLDFEEFLDGLCYQDHLRRLALQLQEYRRMGLTTLSEAAKYDAEKAERQRKAALLAEEYNIAAASAAASGIPMGSLGGFKRGPSIANRSGRDSETPFGDERTSSVAPSAVISQPEPPSSSSSKAKREKPTEPRTPRKPARPLDLSSHPSLHLLSRPEQVLCSLQRIQPSAFLIMKKEMLTEYIRRQGKMTRRAARTLFSMDVNKVGKVYDFLEEQGYLEAAKAVGWTGGQAGIGTPPGWQEKPASEVNGNSTDGQVNGAKPSSTSTTNSRHPSVEKASLSARTGGGIGPSPLSQGEKSHSPFRPTTTA